MKNSWQTWFWRSLLLILFVVALVVLLFWANGFRYDFISNQIRRTGIIDITYSDPGAKVYLDGQKMEGTLPFVINNVLPGRYKLVVGKEGYWDYGVDVEVAADLISMVGSVFLYPLDVLGQAKELQIGEGNQSIDENVILDGGYLWRQQGSVLYYARLRAGLNFGDFKKAEGVDGRVEKVKVMAGSQAYLEVAEGDRYLLDLFSGETKKIAVSANYVFAGDKWVFYQGRVLASLNRQFDKVIWAKQPVEEGESITAVRYFQSQKREFLGVDLSSGKRDGLLYELRGDQLFPLDTGRIDSVNLSAGGDLYYVKDSLELWFYDFQQKKAVFMGRFQKKLDLISSALQVHHSGNLLVLKIGEKYFLADRGHKNVREMFPGLSIAQLFVAEPAKLYFKQNITVSGDEKAVYKIYFWNLEN